jgi:hypothetical protein
VTAVQRIYVFTAMTLGLTAGLLLAQSDGDYQGYMKIVGPTNGSLQKNLAAKDGAAAAADAKKLEDTFKQVEAFWEKRNVPDAVNFAKQAKMGAAAVAKSAMAENIDQASADAKTMAANCGGCHMAHREKTESGFKIK